MLDDLKYIHDHDRSDAFGRAEKHWRQLQVDYAYTYNDAAASDSIVYCAVAGSTTAGHIIQNSIGTTRPLEVMGGTDVPSYVSEKTCFIAADFSGNNDVVLNALEQATAKGATIYVITGGGKLAELAAHHDYPLLILPNAMPLGILKALVSLLGQMGALKDPEIPQQLRLSADFLHSSTQSWLPTVPTANNPAKQLALEVIGKSVVINSGPMFGSVAYAWKSMFNRTAKQIAWWGQYPDVAFSDSLGWMRQPVDKPYAVIELRSDLESAAAQKYFIDAEKSLSGRRPAPNVINLHGDTVLGQFLWAMVFGDFVSLYTAMASGINPSEDLND